METWKRGNEVAVGGLGLEKRAELVRDVQQEMRVFARVFLHIPRQGADSAVKPELKRPPPVRELELLVRGHSAEAFEEIREAEGLEAQHARGAARVEEIDLRGRAEAKLARRRRRSPSGATECPCRRRGGL